MCPVIRRSRRNEKHTTMHLGNNYSSKNMPIRISLGHKSWIIRKISDYYSQNPSVDGEFIDLFTEIHGKNIVVHSKLVNNLSEWPQTS